MPKHPSILIRAINTRGREKVTLSLSKDLFAATACLAACFPFFFIPNKN
jgi:hypothetical protein